jgi:quercetin dioxygenase-like cupin family protein
MPAAILHRWDDQTPRELAPGVRRRFVTTGRMTMARFALARNAVVPTHSHEHEQVSYVLSGALRFTVGGEEILVRGGEVLQIPSWLEHGVTVVEDAEVIDVFSPVRQDWLDGTDTYFQAEQAAVQRP